VWKKNKDGSTLFRCNFRPSGAESCKACVKQIDESFELQREHIDACHAIPGVYDQLRLLKVAKQSGLKEKDRTAKTIVEPLLYKLFSKNKKQLLPKIENWCRSVNKYREDSRPPNPSRLDFTLIRKAIPKEFNVFDVAVDGKAARHLLFFTDEQRSLMHKTKRWFLDGTFSVVKTPFTQLWSIHGMMRSKNQQKQVPMAYVLMSRRTREDYEHILNLLFNDILKKKTRVVEFVCDFEKAVWQSVRIIFGENVKIYGCAFHWTQCLFRNLKKIGLVPFYREDKSVSMLCKQLMTLHLLPKSKIIPNFSRLKTQICDITSSDARKLLRKWFRYICQLHFVYC
jgi:hypothetical protein